MLDLRKRMEAILKKFLLDNKLEGEYIVKQMTVYDMVAIKFKNLMEKDLSQHRVGVYGNGKLTEEFFYCLGYVPETITCIIDQNESDPIYWKLEHVPIIHPGIIESQGLDAVLIPSKKYEDDIKKTLRMSGFDGKVIGIHTWLGEQGVDIEDEFYLYHSLGKYRIINREYVKFVQTGNVLKLLSTILGLLFIHDYCHAEKLIDQHIQITSDYREQLQELKKNIQCVFDEVRQEVVNRTTRHVMLHLVDSLSVEALEGMPHLKRIERENFSFGNLISQYTATRETVMTLMTGYQILEDRLYQRQYFTSENRGGGVVGHLNRQGYKFHFLMNYRNFAFAKMDEALEECRTMIAPEVFFGGLCELLLSEEDTFTYMHALIELHFPLWNPLFHKELYPAPYCCSFEDIMEEYNSSQRYVDEILWFYYQLLNCDQVTQIFMGDHGIDLKTRYKLVSDSAGERKIDTHRWDKKLVHPACIISDSFLGRGRNDHLVANYHFASIIQGILERSMTKEMVEKYQDNYIRLESLPIYEVSRIKKLLRYGNEEYALGFVGVLTEEATFVQIENGDERLFIEGKEIDKDTEMYQKEVEKYRKLSPDIEMLKAVLRQKRFDDHNKYLGNIEGGFSS